MITAINKDYKTEPSGYFLKQSYPNPLSSSTTINYYLKDPGFVELEIYHITGQKIETIFNGFQASGEHQFEWNARDYPNGIYLCRLQMGEFSESNKLIVQK